MSALRSLRAALGSLGRNPVLFLVGLAYGLVMLPQSALRLTGSLFGSLLPFITFFVAPFFVAGTIGMASESLDGETSLSTLKRVGRNRYVPLLVASFVNVGILIGLAIAGGIIVLLIGLLGFVVGIPLIALVAAGLVGLGIAVVLVFIQFYPVAVSLGDTDAIDSFRQSIRLVRKNPLSTIGYSVINAIAVLIMTLPVSGPMYYRQLQSAQQLQRMQTQGMSSNAISSQMSQLVQFSTQEVVLLSAISLAATMLLFTFQQAYATAFYRDHAPPLEDGTAQTDVSATSGGATLSDDDSRLSDTGSEFADSNTDTTRTNGGFDTGTDDSTDGQL
ncbi:hypothetical protein GL213_11375 [Halogeometricum borinquense]|nr:hypothetical protein GL213_11375 [Halogeometricum borinquense]